MKGHGAKLPHKEQQAIAALLEKNTIKGAAEVIGIGETTLFRWLQKTDFQDAYRRAKAEVVGQAISRLQNATGKAVDALVSILEDKEKPASARVTAARTILETAVKAVENEDLQARIERIEKILEDGRK